MMLILKADEKAIHEAARVIIEGGVVVYPTDTVYGVGCNPFNENSVQKVIEAKERKKVPLPVLGSTIETLQQIALFNEKSCRLASRFWPGPLTLVLMKRPMLPDWVTFGFPTVGVRVPNSGVALRLIELSGGLLVGTSANLSGRKACMTALEAAEQIGERVDLILDGGETILKRESTILRVVDDRIELIRHGAISESEARSALE